MTQTASKSDRTILGLLTAAKNSAPAKADPTEATDYDWNAPCSFITAQLEKLQQFAAKAATEIAKVLSDQLHEEVPLQPDQLSQHYVGRLFLLQDQTDNYCFPIGPEGGRQCGLVVIPGQLIRGWVAKALGSTESQGAQERELSSLESALMQDTVATAVQAFSVEFQRIGGHTLDCGHERPVEAALPDARDEDEYCVLAFQVGEENDHAAISFVLASDVLAKAVDAKAAGQSAEKPPGQCRKDLLASVQEASVTAAVWLPATGLSLREVTSLEEGDVLIMDTKTDQPLELLVNGKAILSGHPVSCEGQYALQIAARPGATGREAAPT